MCGLTGWIGEPNVSKNQRLRRARVLEGLLMANANRGTDASGVGMIHTSNPAAIFKKAVSSYNLVDDDAFARIIRAPDAYLALGHTRWGTMGENTDRNAHPYVERHVVGAHNGIIWNHEELSESLEGHKPLRVDSQVAFRLLSSIEPKAKKIVRAIPMIQGSLALTWHDTRDRGALWLFRHDNPLTVSVVPSARSAFWSSEYGDLAVALQSAYGGAWHTIQIKPDTLYRLRWDRGFKSQSWPVKMPTVKIVQGQVGERPPAAPTSTTPIASLIDRIDNEFPIRIPAGELDAPELEDCNVCHADIDYDDDDATWHNEGEGYMLCGSCERWWTAYGAQVHDGDLEEAIAVMDTTGIYANNVGR